MLAIHRSAPITLVLWLLASSVVAAQDPDVDAAKIAFFEQHIRPVLVQHCYECHSGTSEEIGGELRVDSREALREGGSRGPAVVPGEISKSVLIEALEHRDNDLAMPPDQKLSEETIDNFKRWIRDGAIDPRESDSTSTSQGIDIVAGRSFWSFQPPRSTPVPSVSRSDWAINDIDRYLLAAMESQQISPVADCNPRTLARRLYFDLIGLPPQPSEVDAFEQAYAIDAQQATEALVDRLLQSPQFGERWGRHWLDVARFAESTGKTVNFFYPQAWRYRDYVIGSLNRDKPYDQFIVEQLAGDLLSADSPQRRAELQIATGFLAIGPKTLNERSGLKFELDMVDEQIDVTTQAFLGLTVACARCHDHKTDPIPQLDYYALAGIFRSTQTHYGTVRYINAQRPTDLLELAPDSNVLRPLDQLSQRERERLEQQIESTKESMQTMEDQLQRFFASGRLSLLEARLDGFDDAGNRKLLAMGVADKPKGTGSPSRRRPFGGAGGFTYDQQRFIGDSPLFLRGEHDRPSEDGVPRGTLSVLVSTPLEIPSDSSGRLELAQWIASRVNPLTARVMVNRIWLKIFGQGLVPTASDFGVSGRPPTHPELLDHLAIEFMDQGWSVKRLIRYLVTSRAYRMSSVHDDASRERDPDNVWLWHTEPRRLDAECLRDAMLAVSGDLDLTPPIGSAVAQAGEGPVNQPFAMRGGALSAINDPRNVWRSIYLPVIRDNLSESMALFDAADPSLITVDRPQTTVASQGLYLLNNEFVMRAADHAADQLLEVDGREQRVKVAFETCFGRTPLESETELALEFIERYLDQLQADDSSSRSDEQEAWSALYQALFASAEFQYRL